MTYVVCEPCVDCKYTDCAAVCPVDCFYQNDSMLYIDPEQCIDCAACVPACPVNAIFEGGDVPGEWASFVQLNADKSKEIMDNGEPALVKAECPQTPKEGPSCKKKAD